MNFNRQQGMALIVSLFILMVLTILVLYTMDNNLLNQKTVAGWQAQLIAFNGAEAGLQAAESTINGKTVDLSGLQPQVNFDITLDSVNKCQGQIFNLISTASYQTARIKLISSYLQTHLPPLPECAGEVNSHRLWWQQVDTTS